MRCMALWLLQAREKMKGGTLFADVGDRLGKRDVNVDDKGHFITETGSFTEIGRSRAPSLALQGTAQDSTQSPKPQPSLKSEPSPKTQPSLKSEPSQKTQPSQKSEPSQKTEPSLKTQPSLKLEPSQASQSQGQPEPTNLAANSPYPPSNYYNK